MESERDKGVSPLGRAILDRIPGGLMVTSQVHRGVINLNRMVDAHPLPPIWTSSAVTRVEGPLRAIHRSQIEAYRAIRKALHASVPILHLHSMDPTGAKPGTRPSLDRENLSAYVEAHGHALDQRVPRVQDFIAGRKGGDFLADSRFYASLQGLFHEQGIAWTVNDPYDTQKGHLDFEDMVVCPGRVSLVDITKDRLCRAVGDMFDSRTAEVDPTRVGFMADLFANALGSRLA